MNCAVAREFSLMLNELANAMNCTQRVHCGLIKK